MRFDSVKKLKGEAFRRLTGVQRSTFEDMVQLAPEMLAQRLFLDAKLLGVRDCESHRIRGWQESPLSRKSEFTRDRK
jgi:hypothetical protein